MSGSVPGTAGRAGRTAATARRSTTDRAPAGTLAGRGPVIVDRAGQSIDMCTWSVWSLSPLYDCQPVAGNQICLNQIT